MGAHSRKPKWSINLTRGDAVETIEGTSDEVWQLFGRAIDGEIADLVEIHGPTGNKLAVWRRGGKLRRARVPAGRLFGAALVGGVALASLASLSTVSAAVATAEPLATGEQAVPVVVDSTVPVRPVVQPSTYVIRPARTPCQREEARLEVVARKDAAPRAQLLDADEAELVARFLIAQCGWDVGEVMSTLAGVS